MSNRLSNFFATRDTSKKVLSAFITAGFPHPSDTVEIILGMEKAGADIIELGIPFSDPLADGPTIQYASDVAIKYGTSLTSIFEMVRQVRKTSQIPIVLMGYTNPVFHFGLQEFVEECEKSGVDGLIIPDMPPEETPPEIFNSGIPVIYLVAPNTSEERMRFIDSQSHPFVYCVSVTGVTGTRSRQEVLDSVNSFAARVKSNVRKNAALVGFGIKTPADAVEISSSFDGFIVGSAFIDLIRENLNNPDWKNSLFSFVKNLKG